MSCDLEKGTKNRIGGVFICRTLGHVGCWASGILRIMLLQHKANTDVHIKKITFNICKK